MEKYPAFENVPKHYIGIEDSQAGVLYSRKALQTVQKIVQKTANLQYNSEVLSATKNSVTLTDGRVINARHVIVTAGPQTVLNGFDKDA